MWLGQVGLLSLTCMLCQNELSLKNLQCLLSPFRINFSSRFFSCKEISIWIISIYDRSLIRWILKEEEIWIPFLKTLLGPTHIFTYTPAITSVYQGNFRIRAVGSLKSPVLFRRAMSPTKMLSIWITKCNHSTHYFPSNKNLLQVDKSIPYSPKRAGIFFEFLFKRNLFFELELSSPNIPRKDYVLFI